ncbi:MAG: hypothetical protein HY042_02005 [Spirochaetia bacterium]|nr:hypothetical protein [Spirochaetia bacterium]
MKGVGGMRVPIQRARNAIYAACLRECHTVLVQRAVPVLVFPEGARSATGLIGGIRTPLLAPYIDAFHDSGREIAVVPVSLSYENVPDDVELCGLRDFVPFQDFLSRRTGVHMVVSPPVIVSRIAREEEAECALAARINASWHRDLKILPQNIVARVISEHKHKIKETDLEPAVERFAVTRGGNFSTANSKQIAADGLRHLVERGMVYVQNGVAESILRRLVDFYGAPASFEEETI